MCYSYADLSLRYSLTLGSCHSAGHQMKRKLMGILRLKCHALFLDLKVREIMFQSLKTNYLIKGQCYIKACDRQTQYQEPSSNKKS